MLELKNACPKDFLQVKGAQFFLIILGGGGGAPSHPLPLNSSLTWHFHNKLPPGKH